MATELPRRAGMDEPAVTVGAGAATACPGRPIGAPGVGASAGAAEPETVCAGIAFEATIGTDGAEIRAGPPATAICAVGTRFVGGFMGLEGTSAMGARFDGGFSARAVLFCGARGFGLLTVGGLGAATGVP